MWSVPVVTIRALAGSTRDVPRAAAAVSEAIAVAAQRPATDIYVIWEDIAPGHYAIGQATPASQPAETHPPLVEISGTAGRAPEAREAIMRAAADAVAAQVGVTAANVRVLYVEAPRGTIFGRGRIQ
jgi:phenylpyruvate tautomerase PptA (4-oxalocrotonate tautomerase family)